MSRAYTLILSCLSLKLFSEHKGAHRQEQCCLGVGSVVCYVCEFVVALGVGGWVSTVCALS